MKILIIILILSFNLYNQEKVNLKKMDNQQKIQYATFGMGCFWCGEAIFQKLNGVESVISGYAGGIKENPTYDEVCSGQTGHAEVIQVKYNSDDIKYEELLEVFWKSHDPTTINRQGNDVGTQYRSIILYHNDEQKKLAEYYKNKLESEKIFKSQIVTEIKPLTKFYKAEEYHQNYFENNPNKPYCYFVILPKVEKFEKVFKEKIRK